MDLKLAIEHYKNGTATEEERAFVEAELEKAKLIAELQEVDWEPLPTEESDTDGEMRLMRRKLRRRNALTVLTSLVLVAVIGLGTVYIGIPAAEQLYWDPTQSSYGTPYDTDLELMLAAHAELFCPDVNIASVTAERTGFACYDLSIRYWNGFRGGDLLFADGTVHKGKLTIPDGLLQHCSVNIFDRGTHPFFPADENRNQSVRQTLSQLPEYITLVAAVSFPQDKTMQELMAFQDSLLNGQIRWAAIRNGPLEEQLLPLCGMYLFPFGSVRTQINDRYPCLDSKSLETTPENLETHFKSLLKFSADQAAAGTGIEVNGHGQCYYTQVLSYVKENGVYSYGCYVVGTPETFLRLLDSGAVSQVWIEDAWISI